MHSMPLTNGTFWVQLHDVYGFCMMVTVYQAIGSTLGDLFWVDNHDGTNLVGQFIRIRVQFDVTMPLIRQTTITFSEVGEKLIEFK